MKPPRYALFDPDKTVELPAIMLRRRALLSRARRGRRSETGLLRGHSMRCQEERRFHWLPLVVFAVIFMAFFAFVATHGDVIVVAVGNVLEKLVED